MNTEINFDELRELLEARNFKALRTRLADMNEVDVAQFLCELAPEDARQHCHFSRPPYFPAGTSQNPRNQSLPHVRPSSSRA